MKKFIIDEKTGLAYTLVGDYYIPNITLSESDKRPIGMWGRKRLAYLKEHRPALYNRLVLRCKLNSHLADVNEQANERLDRLIEQMAKAEGVNERLKIKDQMLWVARMNNIRNRAEEIIHVELIYD
jgi:hypothetical protein